MDLAFKTKWHGGFIRDFAVLPSLPAAHGNFIPCFAPLALGLSEVA
jgi:hypothetical protein